MQVQISKEVIDKIWDENPSKSEVISRCGWRGRKNQMPTKNRHSLEAKFKQKKRVQIWIKLCSLQACAVILEN